MIPVVVSSVWCTARKWEIAVKFAGPCAQGVLDPVMIPCPMSLGCAVLFVLFKDNAFLGTSAHESVLLAGYLPDTRGFPLNVAQKKPLTKRERARAKSLWAVRRRTWGRPGTTLELT